MKKKVKTENVLLWLIITALLMGALFGALITAGVISAISADAAEEVEMEIVPWEDERNEAASAAEEAEPAKPIETKPEVKAPAEQKKLTDYHVGTCEITAYCTCVKCCGIWSAEHPSREGTGYVQKTATGTVPTAGKTVAVDPSVIPLGSIVLVSGVSYIAEDTGNAVKGKVVDIYFAEHEEAVAFGRQTADVTYIK